MHWSSCYILLFIYTTILLRSSTHSDKPSTNREQKDGPCTKLHTITALQLHRQQGRIPFCLLSFTFMYKDLLMSSVGCWNLDLPLNVQNYCIYQWLLNDSFGSLALLAAALFLSPNSTKHNSAYKGSQGFPCWNLHCSKLELSNSWAARGSMQWGPLHPVSPPNLMGCATPNSKGHVAEAGGGRGSSDTPVTASVREMWGVMVGREPVGCKLDSPGRNYFCWNYSSLGPL